MKLFMSEEIRMCDEMQCKSINIIHKQMRNYRMYHKHNTNKRNNKILRILIKI